MIRYAIECTPGAIIEAPGIKKFTATRGRTDKAVMILYVDPAAKEDFEKAVEGDKHVLGYKADPKGDGKKEEVYARG